MFTLCFRSSRFPNLLAMSHVCTAVTSASNSAAVSTVDAKGRGGGSGSKARLRGVVFDMDGTLTVPVIDFQAMYKAVLGEDLYAEMRSKNPSGIDILHQIEGWNTDRQKKAYEIIAQFEKDGIDRLQIMPGTPNFLLEVGFSRSIADNSQAILLSNYSIVRFGRRNRF